MTDTQWPRFQVFHQARLDLPHENAGSVHAPDPELALLNARDVFVRRPECVSLWVVPADLIASATAEELADLLPIEVEVEPAAAESYQVFVKSKHVGSHRHVGEVSAGSPRSALRQAVATIQMDTALVWWVCPEVAVTRSDPELGPSFFEPSRDKGYRNQGFYRTETLLRDIRRETEEQQE